MCKCFSKGRFSNDWCLYKKLLNIISHQEMYIKTTKTQHYKPIMIAKISRLSGTAFYCCCKYKLTPPFWKNILQYAEFKQKYIPTTWQFQLQVMGNKSHIQVLFRTHLKMRIKSQTCYTKLVVRKFLDESRSKAVCHLSFLSCHRSVASGGWGRSASSWEEAGMRAQEQWSSCHCGRKSSLLSRTSFIQREINMW